MKLEIDQHYQGSKHDCAALKQFTQKEACEKYFEHLKKAFFSVNNWGDLFWKGTSFQMVDEQNINLQDVRQNNLIKIKIPGPGSSTGKGYDWLKIIQLEGEKNADEEWYCITVSPAQHPLTANTAPAHFFQSRAKNYFIIKRCGLTVSAEVHGRNEIPNYQGLPVYDRIRNFFIAHGGKLGLSAMHWETWAKHILKEKYMAKIENHKGLLKIK